MNIICVTENIHKREGRTYRLTSMRNDEKLACAVCQNGLTSWVGRRAEVDTMGIIMD